jgi:hypothetical protein
MPPLPISSSLSHVTLQALDRKSAQLGTLLTQWRDIVGPRIGDVTFPIRLSRGRATDSGAILHLAAPQAWATELRHELPMLISRINGFFGHRAVLDIKLVSRTIRPARPRRSIKPLLPEQQQMLVEAVGGIEDSRLQTALLKLGIALKTHES